MALLLSGRVAKGAIAFIVTASLALTTWSAPMDSMIDAIRDDVRRTASYTGLETIDRTVLDAIRRVPRERYVPDQATRFAYMNRPLAIGHGQTISEPFIVALMTALVEARPEDRMLEIGTGSGYQAAVLAELVTTVYTVEIIDALAREAAQRLAAQGVDNVQIHVGDGWYGWPEHGPYDGILVTAVAPEIPPRLLEQLAPGRHLVLPVGPANGGQMLVRVTKRADGGYDREDILPVQFVPLTGDHGRGEREQ